MEYKLHYFSYLKGYNQMNKIDTSFESVSIFKKECAEEINKQGEDEFTSLIKPKIG